MHIARWAHAYCKVGMCILQGGHMHTARWVYAYCKVGAKVGTCILQDGRMQIARWACACCKEGIFILQSGHVQKRESQLTDVLVRVLIVKQIGKQLV